MAGNSINSGQPAFQPLFRQEPLEGDEVPATEVPKKKGRRPPVDKLRNQLTFSSSWQPEPLIPGQELIYADSVKVISESYKVFDPENPGSMAEYSKIAMSHEDHGHYKIVQELPPQWDEKKGTWKILLRVQERMFKTNKTSDLNPGD